MEGAPKIPSKEDIKQDAKKAAKHIGVALGAAMAVASPVGKVMATPGIPLATEKLVARPEDINKTALKSDIDAKREVSLGDETQSEKQETIDQASLTKDIEAGRAVFKMDKDGGLNRIPSKEE